MPNSKSEKTIQLKLVVNTANEAVSVIKERYGDEAKVLSVKQVEPSGLKRLLGKPKLEVVLEVPQGRVEGAEAERAPRKSPAAPVAAPGEGAPVAKAPPASSPSPISKKYAPPAPLEEPEQAPSAAGGDYFSQFDEPQANPAPTQASGPAPTSPAPEPALGTAANPVRRGTLDAVKRAVQMLESLGFDRSLIERVRAEVDFKNLGSLPTMDLYSRICDWLRGRFPREQVACSSARRAFIGGCGVGKTAALCKMLSAEVFLNGVAPSVLKVDSEIPNPSDALEVFCEIMGSSLARSIDEIEEISLDRPLFVDLPGFALGDPRSLEDCAGILRDLQIEDRILVVNAAYEAELIAEMMAAGDALGATHVVLTHLEETRKAGKLWKFLLNGRIKPIFFSQGPNPAGDYTRETYSYLLERTFPNGRELAEAASRRKVGSFR